MGRPAAKGSILTFYFTGEGSTTPAVPDGKRPLYPDNPRPSQPVRILFGDFESACAENWIGQISPGVTQVNACVPWARLPELLCR